MFKSVRWIYIKITEGDGVENKKKSDLSVILRTRNEEKWIGYAIQSILDNLYKPEIIIIDNNSKDQTLDIVKHFIQEPHLEKTVSKYTNIKIFSINDYSPGKALNFGVKKSTKKNINVSKIFVAYYLDKIEIQNPGHSYTPADTRFEVFASTGDGTEVKLPGVALRGVFSPNTANLEPTTKVVGHSASAYYHSFYREYIEQGGGTDKDWINENTVPNYIDSYTSSIDNLDIEFKRSDLALDGTTATDTFKISSRSDLIDTSREYRAFIGTRDFENAGSMMMFGLGIHDNTEYGEDLIKNSKVYDSFSSDELNALNGSWLCVWDVPTGSLWPNGHNVYANFQAMTENSQGLLKVFYDASAYDSDTSNEYRHFLSENITRFNGRIVKFLRASNNRIFFKVETTLGLQKEPNFAAYGIPDFINLYSRFYPIATMSDYQTQNTKNTTNTTYILKRFKGVLGKRSNLKKAIVTLAPGNTIDLSVGV